MHGSFASICVHLSALALLFPISACKLPHIDLVVSGINNGANVGKASHMSGTVGAAMQALYLGVPAIAVSQDSLGVDTAVTAGLAIRPMGDSYLSVGQYALLEQLPDWQLTLP